MVLEIVCQPCLQSFLINALFPFRSTVSQFTTTSIEIFNFVTPNDDGFNDYFQIENIENFPNSTLVVFNRWGTEVFKDRGYQNDWDGTFLNEGLPDGTYYYILKLNGDRKLSGYVQLQR